VNSEEQKREEERRYGSEERNDKSKMNEMKYLHLVAASSFCTPVKQASSQSVCQASRLADT
jgi:hypothetical protein